MVTQINGGWALGPHLLVIRNKRGKAYLRSCDRAMMFDDPRSAVRFSMDSVDALFLNFGDAAQIVSLLELVGIEAEITDMNSVTE